MGLILDTSVLVVSERSRFDLTSFLEQERSQSFGISAITVAELLLGVERAEGAASRMRRAAFADWIIQHVPVIPFGVTEARRHAELRSHLMRQGSMIGAHDLQIAATAIAGGHALVTLDIADFSRVPGLEVIDPR